MLNRTLGRLRRRGVTLIEMVLVVLIMAVVASAVYFSVQGVDNDSVTAACATDRSAIETAQQVYFAQQGSYATAVSTLVTADLLSSASTMHELDAAGAVVPIVGGKCA